jgi:RIO-like serine/threonine protein kinase
MKLDVNQLRYLEKARRQHPSAEPAALALAHVGSLRAAQDAWRTLVAVEMGMKNHEFVPAPLVDTIAGLRNGAPCCEPLRALCLTARAQAARSSR